MPLTKGAIRKVELDDAYEIVEVPDEIPRDRWKRPLIVPLDGGTPIAYTRASTLGKAIDDTYHLNMWTVRAVVLGMSRRPELVARAAAIATNEGDDRGPLDEIGSEAKTAGGGDQGANVGTALHKLSERRDAGEELTYLPPILFDAMTAYSSVMALFEVLASETFVVCDPLEAAGSFDRVVKLLVDLEFHHAVKGRIVLPAGTVLVLDLKTGRLKSAQYWGPTYGVQQTVYACGQPYLAGVGRVPWGSILGGDLRPSTDWALILHVPSDSPQDAGLVVVELEAGAAMADLCVEIREARKYKGLMSECYPVPMVIDQAEAPAIEQQGQKAIEGAQAYSAETVYGLVDELRAAPDEATLDQLWGRHQSIWNDDHTAAVQERLAELVAPAPEPEKPAQVVALELMAQLRAAQTEDELTALWEAHQDVWTDDATRMVRARLGELGAGVSA